MNNNKIHIDGLVKQRLSAVDERGDAGAAWVKMKSLLDEQMPVKKSRNWRPFYIGLSSLLVLTIALVSTTRTFDIAENSLLSIASNNVQEDVPVTTAGTEGTNPVSSNTPGNVADLPAEGPGITGENAAEEHATANATRSAAVKGSKATSTDVSVAANVPTIDPSGSNTVNVPGNGNNTAGKALAAAEPSAVQRTNAGHQKAKHAKPGIAAPVAANLVSGNGSNKKAAESTLNNTVNTKSETTTEKHPIAQNTAAAQNTTGSVASSGAPVTKKDAAATNKTPNTAGNNNYLGSSRTSAAADVNKTQPAQKASKAAVTDAQIARQIAVKEGEIVYYDTIKQYTLLHKYDGIHKKYVVDTIENGNTVIERRADIISIQNEQQNYMAAAPYSAPKHPATSKSESVTQDYNPGYASSLLLVQNAGSTTHAKTQSAWESTSIALRNFADETKLTLQQVQVQPGIIAGINATMGGNNNFGGFHLGVSTGITLKERWSLLTELRYRNTINSGRSITDNYTTYRKSSQPIYHNNQTYNSFKDSMSVNYNFTNIHSLELPVMVRYTYKQIQLMLGASFVYNFDVKAKETKNLIATTLVNDSTHSSSIPSSRGNVALSDFKARFGIGAMFGVAYQVLPQVSLDMRFSQVYIDNSRSDASKLVSREIYQKPSLQLSISYIFGRPKYMPMR